VKCEVRIGISGWRYAGWRGVFYPKGWPHRRELEFASRAFNSIEINGSFYSLQRLTSYRRWYEETPENFLFSVKDGRLITQMKKLREVAMRLKLWRKGQQPKDAKLVAAKRKSEAHDLFVYFDNDAKVRAPFDAQTLARKMTELALPD
jgi:uncharacterized protein YecE (DUF72 family)